MNEHKLYYNYEAKHYYEAAPVGNGRLGAMMFGGRVRERIALNESGMWSGSPQDADRPEAHKFLPDIQKLLLEGKFKEATELYSENFTCKGAGSGHAVGSRLPFGCYQALGDVEIYFFQAISHDISQIAEKFGTAGAGFCEEIHDYSRQLDMRTGISSCSYKLRNVTYTRECIASRPYECIALHLSKSGPGVINFNLQLRRAENYAISILGDDGLMMTGRLDNGAGGAGTGYAALVKAKSSDGLITIEDNVLQVRGATDVVIYITAATDIKTFGGRQINDAKAAAINDMEKVVNLPWDIFVNDSIQAHRMFYDRSCLSLGDAYNVDATTDSRLSSLRDGKRDIGLFELYYNYGRYLLIASNTPGGLPANLQGIWGDELQTPWNGDWHLDAQQMNFWPAEATGLPELHEPYLKLVNSLVAPGTKTAKAYYNANGWVAHVFTNPWGFTSPGESASWGATTTGSAWACQHIWDHYLFSCDIEYLKWAYPILKGCALFYNDMLIRDPKTNYLVTAPANSPENHFFHNGVQYALCYGPTYDNQLLRYIFSAVINASKLLKTDDDFAAVLTEKMAQLPPNRIGKDGGVMEWIEDYETGRPYHRHISHLWGVYPGDEITPEDTPELAKAARRTIVIREPAGAGWANMHRIAVLARICDGNAAENIFEFYMKHTVYPNLFCRTYHANEMQKISYYPEPNDYSFPFQIDANLAATGCIAEMLLQSHRYAGEFESRVHEINLLPALPDDWEKGNVSGLRARGGFIVDIQWERHTLTAVEIKSIGGNAADVKYLGRTKRIILKKNEAIKLNSLLIEQ